MLRPAAFPANDAHIRLNRSIRLARLALEQKLFEARKGRNMALLNAVVDLSHHNHVTSFQAIQQSGILGIIHKATEGTSFTDNRYSSRRTQALGAGLMWGAYHFGRTGNVTKQVDHFLSVATPTDDELLVLDFEPAGGNPATTMKLSEAEKFVSLVAQRTGRFPGIYSGHSFIHQQLGNTHNSILSQCWLWVARYSHNLPTAPPTFPTFTMWQYTDGSAGDQPRTVPGVSGPCDRDKFNGSAAGLRRLWGHP